MILRICVVIRYSDNPRAISEVVKDVVLETPFPILIVDDGGEAPVANALYSFEVKQAMEQGRLRVARFETTQGKGAALQYAIRDLVAAGYTHMITLDGDGLHPAREIAKLVSVARLKPWDLVIGDRGARPPEGGGVLRRWARRILNYSVRVETGSAIRDTSSGFRLYPLFPVQTMAFRTSHDDFELEVLVRLLWKGVAVSEVSVGSRPAEPGAGGRRSLINHLRLWFLNFALLFLSLLRARVRPRELGLAVGLGVFVGCTPVFGFHTIIVLALAVVLRLNFVALWAGTHVSTPVLFPLVLAASLYIGQHWLGIGHGQGMMGHVYQWAAGGMVLGVVLAIPIGVLTFLIARAVQNKNGDLGVADGRGAAPVMSRFLVRWFGPKAARACLWVAVGWRYLMWFHGRRGLSEYYRLFDPALGFWARQKRILRHFRLCGEIQIDALARELIPGTALVVRDDGNLRQALEMEPRLIALSAHVGCWDVAVEPGQGRRFGAPGGSALDLAGVRRVLAGGRAVRWFGDRPLEGRYELIPILGRLAPMDVGIFRLAVETDTPLLFSFGTRLEDGLYELVSRPPRRYGFRAEVPEELQLYEWVSRYARQLEFFIRRAPSQWFNFFPLWSSLPRRPSAEAVETGAVPTVVSSNVLFEDLRSLPRLKPEAAPAPAPVSGGEAKGPAPHKPATPS
jgi:uncharacterized protein (DUF2062 family)/predicted LPLAT superfamily acyltransferase